MEKKLALITGATSGIGLETARLFAENRIQLILCGRRKDRLEALKEELQAKVQVDLLSFDVSIPDQVKKAFLSIKEKISSIDILINNAGNAHGLNTIDKGNMDDFDKMIDINIKGLLYVSEKIIPHMVSKKSGHIVNIGSIAGKEVYPKGNVYCASKAAVDFLGKAMRIDLAEHGIKVSNINPGLVETEFSLVRFKGDSEMAKRTYQGFTPLTPYDIAELIYFVISRPAHVNIADTLILPLAQPCATIVIKKQ
jgi:3-hydroxy acid dehydrogenase / malonic semialdehyde reductase